MFAQKIIELAQVATSTDINQNLQNTEAQLQNLNANLDLLKEEYNAAVVQPNNYTFFDLSNIYFWFVLAGLLLLAFGLLFLLAELQNKDRSRKSRPQGDHPVGGKVSAKGGSAFGGESIKSEVPEIKEEEIKESMKDEEIAIEIKNTKPEPKKIEAKPKPVQAKTTKKPTGPIKIKVEKVK